MAFIFDTSSFRVLGNYYPQRFPSFWNRFKSEVAAQSILSVREVLNELELQISGTWLWEWASRNRDIFTTPSPAETLFVGQIFTVPHFRMLVGETQRLKGQPVADPFLIACAQVSGGCVVTQETTRPHAARIPNVCQHFSIDCTNVEGFMERNGWQF